MRDSRPTTPRAFRMGDFVPHASGGTSGAHARRCTNPGCGAPGGARLRRGKPQAATLCDACYDRAYPWVMPEPEAPEAPAEPPRRGDWTSTCHCGAHKAPGSVECVTCYRARIKADTSQRPWYGATCHCGRAKTTEARQCKTCRYQGAAS